LIASSNALPNGVIWYTSVELVALYPVSALVKFYLELLLSDGAVVEGAAGG
jgi:hypothetical protein